MRQTPPSDQSRESNNECLNSLRLTDIELTGERNSKDPDIEKKICRILKISPSAIHSLKVLKKSLDRRPRPPRTRFNVAVKLKQKTFDERELKKIPAKFKARILKKTENDIIRPHSPDGKTIIVGSGPAGLAAAWSLALDGKEVVLLERGDDVKTRLRKVGHLWARSRHDPESNPCFGEGGAGTFSDGKLITRSKSIYKQFFLQSLVDFGADPEILVDAQAHVGSDKLRVLASNWRQALLEKHVDYRFNTKVVDLIKENNKVFGVVLANGEKVFADRVIFAVGGHARDSLEILLKNKVHIVPRGLAIGVRIEHPQSLINQALSSYEKGPACEYRLKTQIEGRGVYSFCMCPGGVVVAATAQAGQQVVNGMSYSGKRSPYANSALVVTVDSSAFPAGPLGGLDYQRNLEQKAFELTGQNYLAPAQRLIDFIENRPSKSLPRSTYRPGLFACNLRELLPADIVYHLLKALPIFGKKLKGYLYDDAVLIGVETRTSCPITVTRNEDMSSTLENLYCVGEGAGFSGGILSSAFDSMKVLNYLGSKIL